VFVSDTHNDHRLIPKKVLQAGGDVIISCGDGANFGTYAELKDVADWLAELKAFKTKIFVPGNHDMLMDVEFYDAYYPVL